MSRLEQLLKEISQLETTNDHLYTELTRIDKGLKLSGFPNGLASLKETAEDLIRGESQENQ